MPRKLRLRTPCCRFKVSYLFCALVVTLIDFFILLKYVLQFWEMKAYSEDYPVRVAVPVVVKFIILFALFGIEGLVLRRKQFQLCKGLYGLKLAQIFVVFVQVCSDQKILQD